MCRVKRAIRIRHDSAKSYSNTFTTGSQSVQPSHASRAQGAAAGSASQSSQAQGTSVMTERQILDRLEILRARKRQIFLDLAK